MLSEEWPQLRILQLHVLHQTIIHWQYIRHPVFQLCEPSYLWLCLLCCNSYHTSRRLIFWLTIELSPVLTLSIVCKPYHPYRFYLFSCSLVHPIDHWTHHQCNRIQSQYMYIFTKASEGNISFLENIRSNITRYEMGESMYNIRYVGCPGGSRIRLWNQYL